jgi:hypothetical protein
MPGFDGTGPRGMSPKTGGGRGFCAHHGCSQIPSAGRRSFSGMGSGRGWRNQYHATGLPRWQRRAFCNTPVSTEDEKQVLKNETDFLRSKLQALEERLAELNAECK